MKKYIKYIKQIHYFNSLSEENILQILGVCREVNFTKDEIIFHEGSPGLDFYILIEGTVEIWKNYHKNDMTLVAIQGSGSFFGEMSLIDSEPRSATVRASEEILTLSIKQSDFISIIEKNSSIALAIMKSMSSVIRNSTEKLFTNLNIKSKMLSHETEVRKLSENALRESEEKFRILAENVTDILWIVDYKHDHFIYVSPAVERILGYLPEDLLQKSWHTILAPSSTSATSSMFHEISEAKKDKRQKALHTIEFESNTSDGTLVWLETSFHFLRNKSGNIVNTLGVSRDITKRKEMEQKLADTQALFLAALDQSSAGVVLSDSSGKHIKLVNNVAEKIFDIEKSTCINNSLDKLISDKFLYADGTCYKNDELPIVRAVQQGVVINEEVILNIPGKKKRWLLINAAPIKNDAGDIIAGIAVFPDITKNKELENKTREFGIKFQQARKMESIATLAGGIAHEFNNALFEITGNIELLQMSLDNRDSIENYSIKIKNSALRMANLTKQLLAYSRGGKYQPVPTRLSNIVKKSISKTGSYLDQNIKIVIKELSDDYDIEADLTQLNMAISSIISNSLESIELNGSIQISTYTMDVDPAFAKRHLGLIPGKYSCLTIEDNGKGMPVQIINKIFEPFFTTNFPGRGLGMAAVYGIVKNHAGWIGVKSELGEGTTVNIYIPVLEKSSDNIQKIISPSKNIENKVLIIEDKSAVLAVNREMFEYLGYATLEARSGKEAIKSVKDNSQVIDLAILDFDLPDMKCETVYSEIKKMQPELKILISTGYPIHEVSKALNIDRRMIILKPYSLSTLSLKLKENIKPFNS